MICADQIYIQFGYFRQAERRDRAVRHASSIFFDSGVKLIYNWSVYLFVVKVFAILRIFGSKLWRAYVKRPNQTKFSRK